MSVLDGGIVSAGLNATSSAQFSHWPKMRPQTLRRPSLAVVALLALLPLTLATVGCSQAPQLPNTESAEPNARDGVDKDVAESTPDDVVGAPSGGSAGSSADNKPAEKDYRYEIPAGEPATAKPPPAPPKKTATAEEAPPASEAEREQSESVPSSAPPGRGLGGIAGGATSAPQPSAPTSSPVVAAPAPTAAPAADKDKVYDVVPVFYGTDRAEEATNTRLDYGTTRGLKLNLGRAMVTVPLAHKVPNIERPWVVEIPYFKVKIYEEKEDPAKHFTIQEIKAMTKDQLLAEVRDRLGKSSTFKDHAFVFVHGFNTSFDNALYRTAQISYDMEFDGAAFVYSWPSGGKVASYTYDRGSAEQAEPHLAAFLQMVVRESGAKSISLIAHSMGNELLLRVLERMRPSVPEGVEISQVILAAPDVDRDKFRNLAAQITNFSKGVTLYAASNDRALGYSERFWGGVPRAGDVPAGGPMIVPGVDTIDVTAVSTDSLGLNHSGYAENKTLLNDVRALLLSGVRPPPKRVPSLLTINSEAGVFWRYPVVAAAPN